VIDPRGSLRFIEKAPHDLVIDCQRARNDPQRYGTVHEHVPSSIEVADLTTPDELTDFVFLC
jgi:hypothetical protein